MGATLQCMLSPSLLLPATITCLLPAQTLRVRRVYDKEHKTLLYIAYSTHLQGGHDNDAGGKSVRAATMLSELSAQKPALLIQHDPSASC